MPKQTNTVSRRRFLKGAAYASALSVGGLSSLANASSTGTKQYLNNETNASTVTLCNQSAKTVALDAKRPISLEKVNGWIVVKVNKASEAGSTQMLNLDAGEKLSFAVDSELAPLLTRGQQHPVIKRTVFVGDDHFPASLYNATIA